MGLASTKAIRSTAGDGGTEHITFRPLPKSSELILSESTQTSCTPTIAHVMSTSFSNSTPPLDDDDAKLTAPASPILSPRVVRRSIVALNDAGQNNNNKVVLAPLRVSVRRSSTAVTMPQLSSSFSSSTGVLGLRRLSSSSPRTRSPRFGVKMEGTAGLLPPPRPQDFVSDLVLRYVRACQYCSTIATENSIWVRLHQQYCDRLDKIRRQFVADNFSDANFEESFTSQVNGALREIVHQQRLPENRRRILTLEDLMGDTSDEEVFQQNQTYLHDGIFYYIWGTGADAAWHSRMEDRGTRLVLHHFSPHVYTPIVTRATYCGVHATVIVCCPIEGDRTCVAKHDSDIVDPVAIDVVKCFRATFEGGGSSTASRDRPPRGAQLHCGTDARLYLIGNASWLCAVPELVDVSIQQQPQTQGAEGLLATTPVFPKRTYFFPTTHYFKEQLSNSNKNSRFPSWCNDDAMDGANRKSAFATDDDIISSSESRDSIAAVQRIIDVVIPEIALEVVEKLLDFDTILSMFHDRGVPSRFLGLLMTYLVRVTVPPVSIIRSIQIEVVSRALHDLIRMDWEEDWRRRRGKVFKPQQLPVGFGGDRSVGISSPLRRPSTAIIPSKNIRRSVTPGPSLAMSTSSLTSSSPQEEPHVPACFARAQHLLKIVMAYPGAVPYDSADDDFVTVRLIPHIRSKFLMLEKFGCLTTEIDITEPMRTAVYERTCALLGLTVQKGCIHSTHPVLKRIPQPPQVFNHNSPPLVMSNDLSVLPPLRRWCRLQHFVRPRSTLKAMLVDTQEEVINDMMNENETSQKMSHIFLLASRGRVGDAQHGFVDKISSDIIDKLKKDDTALSKPLLTGLTCRLLLYRAYELRNEEQGTTTTTTSSSDFLSRVIEIGRLVSSRNKNVRHHPLFDLVFEAYQRKVALVLDRSGVMDKMKFASPELTESIVSMLHESTDFASEHLPEKSWQKGRCLMIVASTLLELERAEEAEALLMEADEALKVFEDAHPLRIVCQKNLAFALSFHGRRKEALQKMQRAINAVKLFQRPPEELSVALNGLGQLKYMNGFWRESFDLFNESHMLLLSVQNNNNTILDVSAQLYYTRKWGQRAKFKLQISCALAIQKATRRFLFRRTRRQLMKMRSLPEYQAMELVWSQELGKRQSIEHLEGIARRKIVASAVSKREWVARTTLLISESFVEEGEVVYRSVLQQLEAITAPDVEKFYEFVRKTQREEVENGELAHRIENIEQLELVEREAAQRTCLSIPTSSSILLTAFDQLQFHLAQHKQRLSAGIDQCANRNIILTEELAERESLCRDVIRFETKIEFVPLIVNSEVLIRKKVQSSSSSVCLSGTPTVVIPPTKVSSFDDLFLDDDYLPRAWEQDIPEVSELLQDKVITRRNDLIYDHSNLLLSVMAAIESCHRCEVLFSEFEARRNMSHMFLLIQREETSRFGIRLLENKIRDQLLRPASVRSLLSMRRSRPMTATPTTSPTLFSRRPHTAHETSRAVIYPGSLEAIEIDNRTALLIHEIEQREHFVRTHHQIHEAVVRRRKTTPGGEEFLVYQEEAFASKQVAFTHAERALIVMRYFIRDVFSIISAEALARSVLLSRDDNIMFVLTKEHFVRRAITREEDRSILQIRNTFYCDRVLIHKMMEEAKREDIVHQERAARRTAEEILRMELKEWCVDVQKSFDQAHSELYVCQFEIRSEIVQEEEAAWRELLLWGMYPE